MFKVKNNLSPSFMRELFSYNEGTDKFVGPRVNKVIGECSMRNFGPIVWNTMVPQHINSSSDLDTFKKLIESWVPKEPFKIYGTTGPGCMRFLSKKSFWSRIFPW